MVDLSQVLSPRPCIIAIVQARAGGTRYPGKVFELIDDKPMLWWVVNQVRHARCVDQVVVATPDKSIASMANEMGVWGYWHRGDETDVLARYLAAARWSGADVVVRITADCPLVCPDLIDQCIEELALYDRSSNVNRTRFPKGVDCEVIPCDILPRLDRLSSKAEREHVTVHMTHHPDMWSQHVIHHPIKVWGENVSVDNREGIDKIRRIYRQLDHAVVYYPQLAEVLRNGVS